MHSEHTTQHFRGTLTAALHNELASHRVIERRREKLRFATDDIATGGQHEDSYPGAVFHKSWADPPIEIRAEDPATYQYLLNNDLSVHDVTAEFATLAPNTELEWVKDADTNTRDDADANVQADTTAENAPITDQHPPKRPAWRPAWNEAEAMFASLQRELQMEMDETEWESVLNMPRKRRAEPLVPPTPELPKSTPVEFAEADAAAPQRHAQLPAPPLPTLSTTTAPSAAQPRLAIQSVVRMPVGLPLQNIQPIVDDLQTIRTSMPPVHKARWERVGHFMSIAAGPVIILATVLAVWLTPGYRMAPPPVKDEAIGTRWMASVIQQRSPRSLVFSKSAALHLTGAATASTPLMLFTLHEIENAMLYAHATVPTPILKEAFPNSATTASAAPAAPVKAAPVVPAATASADKKNGKPTDMPNTAVSAAAMTPEVAAPLPQRPSRAAVKYAMSRVARVVSKCRTDKFGRLLVEVSFSGKTGGVTAARVLNDEFRGTPTEECALRAVRHARLPEFQNDKLLVKYPFDFK